MLHQYSSGKWRDEPLMLTHWLEVARGNVRGFSVVQKFGKNDDVGTSYETIWSGGGLYTYPSVATTMTVSSGSTDDVATSGTGAWTVTVYGLDGDYAEINETASLNGQTGVTLSNQYLRVFRIVVDTAGSGGTNAGIIYVGSGTVTSGVPANVFARVEVGDGQTGMAVYTIPAGKTGYVTSGYLSVGAGKTLAAKFTIRPPGGVFNAKYFVNVYQAPYLDTFTYPLKVPEKYDLEVRGKVDATSIACSAGFEILLVNGVE